MNFFERSYALKTDSIFNFVCSGLNALVLSPIRLLQEIGKKVVYLKRRQIDTLLFTTICLSAGLTAIECLHRYVKHSFSFLSGNLPVACMLVGDGVIFAIYALFSTNKFAVYDNLTEGQLKRELRMHTPPAQSNPSSKQESAAESVPTSTTSSTPSKTAKDDSSQKRPCGLTAEELQEVAEWLVKNDYFTAGVNKEILNSQEVADYQERLSAGVQALPDSAQQTSVYPASELTKLKQQIDLAASPSKFVSQGQATDIQNMLNVDEVALCSDINFGDLDESLVV